MKMKKRLVSGFLVLCLALLPGLARAQTLNCGSPEVTAIQKFLQTRKQRAFLRGQAMDDRISDLTPQLKSAKTVAYVSAGFGILGTTAAGVALGAGPAGVGSLVATLAPEESLLRVMMLGGLGTLVGVKATDVLSAIPDSLAPDIHGVDLYAAGFSLSQNQEYFLKTFDTLHDQIAGAWADEQNRIGDHWYKLGFDDVAVIKAMIAEAQMHRQLYDAEFAYANSVQIRLNAVCRAPLEVTRVPGVEPEWITKPRIPAPAPASSDPLSDEARTDEARLPR